MGLGNPGESYANTRHNLGFRVVDELADRRGIAFQRFGPDFARAETATETGRLVLLKPLTYMNRSGLALARWAAGAGVRLSGTGEPDCLAPVIVFDDLALPLGTVRIRARGGAGGQKGLISVIDVLGGEEFPRVRLGIAGGEGVVPADLWTSYVLEPFAQEEREIAARLVQKGADAVSELLASGPEIAASRFNQRLSAEPDGGDPAG